MRRGIGKLALAVVLGACSATVSPTPLPLLTQASPAAICMFARYGGTLVVDSVTGLGLDNDGRISHVRWPFGYTARPDGAAVLRIDPQGHVLARTGDRVAIGGGYGSAGDGAIVACPGIDVRSTPVP
jgi:hypothetical protein